MPKKKSFRRHSLVVVVVVATLLGVTASKNVTKAAEKSRNDWRDSKGKKFYVFVSKLALLLNSNTESGGRGLHGTEEAFTLLTQRPRVRILALLLSS